MRKLITIMLTALLTISLALGFQQQEAGAKDDITGSALEKEMRAMIEKGIMAGYGNGVYKPNEQVTRGQFATFIQRALKLPEGEAAFTDVPNESSLALGINSAYKANIIGGYTDGTFRPNNPITREQVAAIIDRALDYLQVPRTEADVKFSDADLISPNFKLAVSHNVHDKIIVGVSNGDGTYRFNPKSEATRAHAAAFIYRMLETAEASVQPPEEGQFQIGTINATGNVSTGTKKYKTYKDALAAMTNQSNQVILSNGQIVKMASGLVVTNPIESSITLIYSNPNFSKASELTYLPRNEELEYIDSTDEYVKVKLAGMTVYVKHTEVKLIPDQQVKDRNTYSVNANNELVHTLYNQATGQKAAYVMGKAPSFLVKGQNYYSNDGGVFTDQNGKVVGTSYQYFNYLSVRVSSSYSADQLDRLIDSLLQEKEDLYKQNPTTYIRYKDATKNSKIRDLGKDLKAAEEQYRVNGLLLLAWAIHESDYGMSTIALTKNNLFGINAHDGNTNNAASFPTPGDSIKALINDLLNPYYIAPDGGYRANGAALGNKSRGFNVKYASDPYWGQKIAGTWYNLDKRLGSQDMGKYRIAETTTKELNIRKSVGVSDTNLLFQYMQSGMPVVILATDNSTNSIWYKIVSDEFSTKEAYVSAMYIKDMNIVK